MIKECKVEINNEAVTVIDYDGTKVQLPAIHENAKTIFVNYENGKYTIVNKETANTTIEKKTVKKKTTKATDSEKEIEDDEG